MAYLPTSSPHKLDSKRTSRNFPRTQRPLRMTIYGQSPHGLYEHGTPLGGQLQLSRVSRSSCSLLPLQQLRVDRESELGPSFCDSSLRRSFKLLVNRATYYSKGYHTCQ